MSTSPLPTVLDVLLANAAATPDKLAFEIEGEAETYAGLLERIRRMAGALSRYGLGPGERCAIALPTSLDSLIAVLASQWTGGAPVIVDDKLPAGMIVNRLRLVRPRVVIGSEELIASLRQADHALTCELLTPDRISGEAASATVFDHRAVITEPAYLQLTSGTTGEPKAAVVSHSALSHFLRMFRDQIGFHSGDIFITWVPLYHDYGLIHFAFTPLFVGAEGHMIPPAVSNFPRWLRDIHALRATVTGGPDFGYRMAARLVKPETVDLSSLRVVGSGGEPVKPDTIRRFMDIFNLPNPIMPGYGQAETTLAISGPAVGEPLRIDENGNVANGRPFPGFTLRIADEEGNELPGGRVGQIHVKGPYLFDGYFEDAEATAAAFVGDWLDTGDTGYLDDEGYLFILGRRRAMIKRAGALIAPREIEEAAERISHVRKSAAIGAPESAEGSTEKVVLLAEIAPGKFPTLEDRTSLANEISNAISEGTGHTPGDVFLVKPGTIELTHNGKIRYPAIRQKFLDGDIHRSGCVLFPLPPGQSIDDEGESGESPS